MGAAMAALGQVGCGPGAGSSQDTDDADTGTDGDPTSDTDDETGGEVQPGDAVRLAINRDVDIMLLVDNSASMGEEQGKLAADIGVLVDTLEGAGANYRIGVTTTDNGNPWCSGTTPEGGSLRATSCLSRQSEFVFEGAETIDALNEACASVCDLPDVMLDSTTVDVDVELRPRPWIEGGPLGTNVSGASVSEALACIVPQGIDGCGFEQPLESAHKAVQRSNFEAEDGFGFLRVGAVHGFLVVSDESDCSYTTDEETIFLPDGDRAFWSDPSAGSPTSAVCWNAGVRCDGRGPSYADCEPADYEAGGSETSSDSAVMRPVDRYVDLLQELEDSDNMFAVEPRDLVFAVLGGVSPDGSISFSDGQDPAWVEGFGIGPGCVSSDGEAFPPVRMRAVAQEFSVAGEQNLFPICDSSFAYALEAFADQLVDQIVPACVPACVEDTEPGFSGVQPQCTVQMENVQLNGNLVTTQIPACEGGAPPGVANICWDALTGADMSDFCAGEGWNLEMEFTHGPDGGFPPGATVEAVCEYSTDKSTDCPSLP